MGIKEILRSIWLISANKIKPSESICKQSSQIQNQTQVIIVTNNCHNKYNLPRMLVGKSRSSVALTSSCGKAGLIELNFGFGRGTESPANKG